MRVGVQVRAKVRVRVRGWVRFSYRHELQRAHVVQPIGELDDDDAPVVGHRYEHRAQVLRLVRVRVRVRVSIAMRVRT